MLSETLLDGIFLGVSAVISVGCVIGLIWAMGERVNLKTLHTFQTTAKVLIAEHLGRKWKFRWHNGLSSYGICDFDNKTISMSKPLTRAGTLKGALEILAHELAHALTPDEPGHGPEWKEMCKRLGANPVKASWEKEIERLRGKILGKK